MTSRTFRRPNTSMASYRLCDLLFYHMFRICFISFGKTNDLLVYEWIIAIKILIRLAYVGVMKTIRRNKGTAALSSDGSEESRTEVYGYKCPECGTRAHTSRVDILATPDLKCQKCGTDVDLRSLLSDEGDSFVDDDSVSTS